MVTERNGDADKEESRDQQWVNIRTQREGHGDPRSRKERHGGGDRDPKRRRCRPRERRMEAQREEDGGPEKEGTETQRRFGDRNPRKRKTGETKRDRVILT